MSEVAQRSAVRLTDDLRPAADPDQGRCRNRTVKEWARANGYQALEIGRIHQAVVDAFDAAN